MRASGAEARHLGGPGHIRRFPRPFAGQVGVEGEKGRPVDAAHDAGAPSAISFHFTASRSASKLASTILADTPTVDQRRPLRILAVDDDAGHGLGAALGDAHLEIDQPDIVDDSADRVQDPWPAPWTAR